MRNVDKIATSFLTDGLSPLASVFCIELPKEKWVVQDSPDTTCMYLVCFCKMFVLILLCLDYEVSLLGGHHRYKAIERPEVRDSIAEKAECKFEEVKFKFHVLRKGIKRKKQS